MVNGWLVCGHVRHAFSPAMNFANTIKPSGHGPWPLSWFKWPLWPASMNSEPQSAAISLARSNPQNGSSRLAMTTDGKGSGSRRAEALEHAAFRLNRGIPKLVKE